MTLTPGTQLGPYEVVAPLGAGGMGEVYRARDPRLGREVAIKVLPEELVDEPERLQRFENEAKAAGALNHPNVLAIHDIRKHEGRPYVVYELLEGETLGERMRAGRLSQGEALDCAVQTARGLAAAHAKGIVHRDLKPENLFLTKGGPLKILDFGLAKLARPLPEDDASFDPEDLTRARESLTAEGAILGTAGYMSPEQVRGERADHRADIFSLGVVLHEMLSGERPFKGETVPETLTAILKADPPELTDPEVLPALAEIVGRCLAKEPEARFQSAQDLSFALGALSGVQVDSGYSSEVGQEHSAGGSLRKLALLGVGLAVVAGLAFALWTALRPSGPPQMLNPRLVSSGDATPYFATDGRWLYQSTPAGLFQLSVVGGQPSRLDPWPDKKTIPFVRDLSPADSTQLLVGGLEAWPETPFEPDPLWVLTLPTATPRRVGEVLSSAAVWSPDGEQIAYANGRDVYVIAADGESPRKIATVEGMAAWVDGWWPDGRIIYASYDFTGRTLEAWEVRADGTEPRRLMPDWPDPFIWDVERTPDGRHLLFVAGDERGGRFWTQEEGSGDPVSLTPDPLGCYKLDLAPDGSAAYSNCAKVRSELFSYRSEIGEWAPYDFAPESSAWWLVDSPDGEWVAWIQYPEGTLWRGRRDGTQKLRLTEPEANLYATFPSWSPDGQWIAFGRGTVEGIVQQSWVVSRDGQGLRRLDDGKVWANRAGWFPDGRVVLSFWGRLPLRLVDLETGGTEDMPGTNDLWGPSLSPDGRFLAAHGRGQEGGEQLRLLDVATGDWCDLEGAVGGLLQWSTDSRFLYYTPEGEGLRPWHVARYRLDDGNIETVAKLANLDPQSPLIWWTVDPEDRVVAQRSLTTSDLYAWDLELP